MIGNDNKNVQIKGEKAMVRIGGNSQELESYILEVKENEEAQMKRQMEAQAKSWDEIVVLNLKKYKTNKDIIDEYEKWAQGRQR